MFLFKFTAAKDVFAAFYKNDLAKRLLLNRRYNILFICTTFERNLKLKLCFLLSVSSTLELNVISLIKMECGISSVI